MFSISLIVEEESLDSIESDYELLKTMYSNNELTEIQKDSNTIIFLLKLNYEIKVEKSIIELLFSMKLDDLIINDELIYLPYWIKFNFNKNDKLLLCEFYIYWLKIKKNLITILNENIKETEEPYIYNIIENTKISLDNSLNLNNLLNILMEIKEQIVINLNISTDNFLFKLTGANKDLENYRYEDNKIKLNYNYQNNKKLINDISNNHLKEEEEENLKTNNNNNKEKKEIEDKELSDYEKFFEAGGVVGEIIEDRKSIFQSHAIKIKNLNEINIYRNYILSQKKIKKATHNISAYRFTDENGNEIEDYDDDGEHDAGIRVLGILKKMKINNIFIVVTRWYGGILLHQDRFKRITDCAKFLIQDNINIFK
jgi:hypothetical protein